jgi:nitrogen-specific signal transduction histidine kinase
MENQPADNNAIPDAMRELRHNIRNQLSNIQLALEGLQYEMPAGAAPDYKFYIDTIATSCDKLKALLDRE